MSILVSSNTRILVQGITGSFGAQHARLSLAYGTQLVAGVTPGRGGQMFEGKVPIFDTVAEAVKQTGATASAVFVPPAFAADAILEGVDIKHRGRKSGKEYLTPVNYAIVDGEIYCTAGFGSISDWYRNMLVHPTVELWLPGQKCSYLAEDVSDSPKRLHVLRQVLIASGFAAPMFGIDPRKINDEQLEKLAKDYRLVHFKQ